MDKVYFEFEKEVERIDSEIDALKIDADKKGVKYSRELNKLGKQRVRELENAYSGLNAYQTVKVARHDERPVFNDYLERIFRESVELHGDRCSGEDPVMYTGFCEIGRERVLLVGTRKRVVYEPKEKTQEEFMEKVRQLAGCAQPWGYRKAISKMKLAEKFGLPIVTLIDTPGACPGIEAEKYGQAQAIANNLFEMPRLKVPIISVVIGEGGSGGALGIGVANSLAMMEHAYYSVISPEGGAAILWKSADEKEAAAKALRLTSADNKKLGTIEHIVKEPLGGAHRSHHDAAYNLEKHILKEIRKYKKMKPEELVEHRGKMIERRAGGELTVRKIAKMWN